MSDTRERTGNILPLGSSYNNDLPSLSNTPGSTLPQTVWVVVSAVVGQSHVALNSDHLW